MRNNDLIIPQKFKIDHLKGILRIEGNKLCYERDGVVKTLKVFDSKPISFLVDIRTIRVKLENGKTHRLRFYRPGNSLVILGVLGFIFLLPIIINLFLPVEFHKKFGTGIGSWAIIFLILCVIISIAAIAFGDIAVAMIVLKENPIWNKKAKISLEDGTRRGLAIKDAYQLRTIFLILTGISIIFTIIFSLFFFILSFLLGIITGASIHQLYTKQFSSSYYCPHCYYNFRLSETPEDESAFLQCPNCKNVISNDPVIRNKL